MINPRNTFVGHRVIKTTKEEVVYKPDFTADNQIYREFGCNNEIDIMRNKPQYEGVVNSKLRQITDLGMDTSQFSDEQLCEGIAVGGRLYDSNEVAEFLAKDKETRQQEINSYNKLKNEQPKNN